MTYISLLSGASLSLFPENTLSSFRVKLPQPIQLKRDRFQLGLSSIEWPHRFNNVRFGRFKVELKPFPSVSDELPPGGSTGGGVPQREVARFEIGLGHYKTVEYLIAVINEKIKNLTFRRAGNQNVLNGTQHCQFIYDDTSGQVRFECAPDTPANLNIILPEALYTKLGFTVGNVGNTRVKHGDIGEFTVDLNAGVNGLFVYCDVIENRAVGDVIAPLLKIVPIQGSYGDIIHYEPTRVEYCDIRYDHLDEIKIDIRSDTGELVPFLSGKVMITLHIKRRGLL